MIHLPAVLAAAEEVEAFCRKQHWPFCFIGGVAVQRWGEPRLTQDVDLTLITGFGGEESFTDALLEKFIPRRPDAREFALQNRVLLIQTATGTAVDVALGAFPFEERTIKRASAWDWAESRSLFTCAAEDLVIHKVFAGRAMDWGDVERILQRQHGKLNLQLVHNELPPFLELKGALDCMSRLDDLIDKVNRQISAD